MRGALTDISQLSGFGNLQDRFYDSAWIPYRYKGGVYAVPESQSFDMLFYRTDILAELGLEPPRTWDEFYRAIAVLQARNLQVGLLETDDLNPGVSSGISTFDRLLYQNGGQYYDDELKQTMFNTEVANKAFEEWVELYTLYGLPRTFDFFNRFRTGEIPLSIQNYGMYNKISQAAPDIAGLWKMAPIPGTPKKNGVIDRTETAVGTGCVMLRNIKNADDGLSFLDWWTGAEAQIRYGNELESMLGPAARANPANIEAFENLRWTDEEARALREQWEWVTDIPQIPGNYYVSRMITNSFRMCVLEQWRPRYAFSVYNRDINYELARKSEEFSE
jgi:ABC-type glycerol-3-phosphate transport system substrate-binding protein